MNKILIAVSTMLIAQASYAQTDTILTLNKKIPCKVKAIEFDVIKYSALDNENLLVSIFKNQIQKIKFFNGKEVVYEKKLSLTSFSDSIKPSQILLSNYVEETEGFILIKKETIDVPSYVLTPIGVRPKFESLSNVISRAYFFSSNLVYMPIQEYTPLEDGMVRISAYFYTSKLIDFTPIKNKLLVNKRFECDKTYHWVAESSALSNKITTTVLIKEVKFQENVCEILININDNEVDKSIFIDKFNEHSVAFSYLSIKGGKRSVIIYLDREIKND